MVVMVVVSNNNSRGGVVILYLSVVGVIRQHITSTLR